MYNNKPNYNFDRSKDNSLGYAGRTISGQGNRIDRNYIYQQPPEKADPIGIDVGNFLRNNPMAYERYQQNLQKMNESKQKMDEYAEQMKGRQVDLYGKFRDMEGAKKLNEMNAQRHNDYLNDQMNNIRNYKPLKRNFSSHIQKPNVVNRYGDTFVDQKEVLLNDNSMKLLDDYSASNNLQDPFSGVARGRSGYMLERNKSFNNVYKRSDLDDTEIMPDLIPNQKAMVFDPNPNYQNPNNISINPMYPTPIQQPQINPYQNPYMPQMNPYGYPYGNMMQNNFPFFNQPMGMGGGYYPQFPPQQQQQESNKKETDIISAHIEKQAQILEALSKRLDGSPKERKRSRGESREFETRMRELERENELKIQLIKQKQVIDNLMNGQGNPDMGNLGQLNANNSFNPNYYQQQLQQLQQLTQMQALQLQQMQQQQQELLLNQQYDYVPDYGGLYVPNQLEDDKKKKKKKKKKDSSESSESEAESKTSKNKKDKKKDDDDKSSKTSKKPKNRRDSDSASTTSTVSKASTIQGFESPKKKRRILLRKMRVLCWTMTYPMLLAKDVKQRVDRRKNKQMTALDTTASPFLQSMSFYMMNACQNGFVEIFKDAKKSYDFIGVKGKKPTDNQKDERINLVLGRITKICDLLFSAADSEIDEKAMEFLAQVCLNENGYVPDYVLTTFELKRLEFNAYGRILSMSKENARMIVVCSAVIRILIFRMILRAKDWNQKIKFTETLELNLLILASVFYMIIGKFVAERNTVLNRNMREVAPKPAQPLLATQETPVADPYKTDEMIVGLYPWDDVNVVFLADYQPWIDTITNLVERWSDKIYQRILEHRRDHPLPPTAED